MLRSATTESIYSPRELDAIRVSVFHSLVPGIVESPGVRPEDDRPVLACLRQMIQISAVHGDVFGGVRIPFAIKDIPTTLHCATEIEGRILLSHKLLFT